MNPKLRNLLKLAGVIIVAGTGALVPMWEPKPGVTVAQLVDAGIVLDSTSREARCLFVCGNSLETRRVKGRYFGTGVTGGFVPTKNHMGSCTPFSVGTHQATGEPMYVCQPIPVGSEILAANEDERVELHQCACGAANAAGTRAVDNCEKQLPNLTWVAAPAREHLEEGKWRGSSCVRKACGELGGISTWPTACGPESLR